MNPRDFLTTAAVGLVLVVGAFALVDSVRGCDTSQTEATPPPATTETTGSTATTETGPLPQGEAPSGWPQGELSGVLTFLDEGTCQLRAVGLAGGRERPLPDYPIGCGEQVWAPKTGGRVAFRTRGPSTGNRFQFTLRDVSYGPRDFGTHRAFFRVIWSPDGQRVAWCTSRRRGAEQEFLGGEVRPLAFCPIAYTPQGSLAHAEGRRLVIGPTVIARAGARIADAQFGNDGSVVVLTERARLERHAPGRPPVIVELPQTANGDAPVVSPDACAAAVPVETGVQLIPLGCFVGPRRTFSGTTAAWSPDGAWLAVADGDAIAFHSMTSADAITWPATATQLFWRTS